MLICVFSILTRLPVPFLEVVFRVAFFFFFFEHSAHLRRLSLSLFLQAWFLPCAHLDMNLDPNTELNFRLDKGAACGQQAVPSRPLRDPIRKLLRGLPLTDLQTGQQTKHRTRATCRRPPSANQQVGPTQV